MTSTICCYVITLNFFCRIAEKARFSVVLDDVDLTDGSEAIARQFINVENSQGLTPLQIALKEEHISNAKILIANGADIAIRLVLYSQYMYS